MRLDEMSHTYSTNKVILKISMKEPFWEFRNSAIPDFPPLDEDGMKDNFGYYLADRATGTGLQKQYKDATLEAVSPLIFKQELAEAGIHESCWPDTNDVKLFRNFFRVEQYPLIADYGNEPVKNVRG